MGRECARRLTEMYLIEWLGREEIYGEMESWLEKKKRASSEEHVRTRWRELVSGEESVVVFASEILELPRIVCKLIQLDSLATFMEFWRPLAPKKPLDRLFHVLSQGKDFLCRRDLDALIGAVLTHPGLAFLEDHVEFQEKYGDTVAARIFYRLNLSRTGYISRREFLKSTELLEALFALDDGDINAELNFFSYEHFYVIFCRFWDLDSDKKGYLNRGDLLKYGGHRLSRAIVDRLVTKDGMDYTSFVFFMLSEEDKTTEASLRYWFAAVDVDADGVLDSRDARFFYDSQAHRMECLGHEVVPLSDVLCQMADLLDTKQFTLEAFLSKRSGGVFFDALFSLDKFLAFEQRDPFAERLKREDEFQSDWHRFAHHAYSRLAREDDEEDDDAVGF